MSARTPSARAALLVWAAVCTLGGPATGYMKTRYPLLERDRRKSTIAPPAERDRLQAVRDAAVSRATQAGRKARVVALFDSLKPTTTDLAVDVRLANPEAARAAEAAIRKQWRLLASPAIAAPVGFAVRDDRQGLSTAMVSAENGACRAVLFYQWKTPADVEARSSTEVIRRSLGTCLFLARYGAPGRAAASVLAMLERSSYTPCFARDADVLLGRCRIARRGGPPLQTTWRVQSWYAITHPLSLACAAQRPGACERYFATGADQLTLSEDGYSNRMWELRSLLPNLEAELRPAAFARFWKSEKPLPQAIEEVTGRPASQTLRVGTLPAFARYAPGPTLRLSEAAWTLALILLAIGGSLFALERRTATSV